MNTRVFRLFVCALVIASGVASTAAQDKLNPDAGGPSTGPEGVGVSLTGHTKYGTASTEFTDVYFHKNLAYIGTWTTPGRVYIASPVTTDLVGTYNTSNGSLVRDLQVQGNYLYVALDSQGVDIVDISNPAAPTLVKFFNTGFPTGVHDLFIHGDILYCVEDTLNSNLHVIDVSNRAVPVRLTVFDNPGGCHDITLVGNRAYLANLSGGFQIVDVTNPAAPVSLAIKNYTNSFTHNIWPSPDGRYVCTTDETCGSGFLRIWDIQNLSNIVQVGAYVVPNMGSTCVHNGMWVDNYVYMSYYLHGLRIVDVSNPLTPTEVGSYNTFSGVPRSSKHDDPISHDDGGGGCFDGAWGIYAERSSANTVTVNVSDIGSGLWAFTFNAPNLAFEGPGVYSASAGLFHLRNTNTAGVADATVVYGPASSWVGLSGDWDGNGTRTLGVYDPSTSVFHLRNSNTAGPADVAFQYGPPNSGWVPVVGDWDGNDTVTVGLYDPVNGVFHLRNSNSAGPAHLAFQYGPGGGVATPVVGDWDGSGNDTVAVYVGSTSVFYLRNTNNAGFADLAFQYCAPNPANIIPVAGNWDGVGGDSVGIYSRTGGVFAIRNDNAPGPAELTWAYGPGGSAYVPLVGDWGGPGH